MKKPSSYWGEIEHMIYTYNTFMSSSCLGYIEAHRRIAVGDVDLDFTASSFSDLAIFIVDSLDLEVCPCLT